MAGDITQYKFKPGQTGNRNGRPRKLPDIDKVMIELMHEPIKGKQTLTRILEAMRAKAMRGDVRAAELLLDRTYGKVKQTIDTNLSGAIAHKLIIVDATGNNNSAGNGNTGIQVESNGLPEQTVQGNIEPGIHPQQ